MPVENSARACGRSWRGAPLEFSLGGRKDDLRDAGDRGVVYHLLGRYAANPTFALTDEQVLETIHRLAASEDDLQGLFSVLRRRNLLLIGCEHPDWLARIFLRVLRNARWTHPRDEFREILVDRNLSASPSLVAFLQEHRAETYDAHPADFLSRLHRAWSARAPQTGQPSAPVERPNEPRAGKGFVFVSYASEDRARAERIHRQLSDAGVDCWVDVRKFVGGERWEEVIRDRIDTCAAFLALVTATTRRRRSGVFRSEWMWATRRAESFFGTDSPFLFVARCADAGSGSAGIPREWNERHHVTVGDDDRLPPAVVESLSALTRSRENGP